MNQSKGQTAGRIKNSGIGKLPIFKSSRQAAGSSSHWIKPLTSEWFPPIIVGLSCRGEISHGSSLSPIRHYRLAEWSVSIVRHDGSEWGEPVDKTGTVASEFWELIRSLSKRRRRPWIVSYQCEQDWTLLNGWHELDEGRIDFGSIQPYRHDGEIVAREKGVTDRCSMVFGQAVTILCHRIEDSFLTWIDTHNYCDATLGELADFVNFDRPALTDINSPHSSFAATTQLASSVVRQWLTRSIDYWRKASRGPWRTTAAQLAHACWRSSHYTHKVLEHGIRQADELERAAIYGGRASVWYAGDIGKPIRETGDERTYPTPHTNRLSPSRAIHIDVRSMYPWLLREKLFPVRLARVRENVPLAELAELLKLRACIARVRVRTERAEYPARWRSDEDDGAKFRGSGTDPGSGGGRDRVWYPVGHWVGCYAGPELEEMIGRGEIESVESVADYEQAPAFESFARSILEERVNRRRAGDMVGESMAKLLANAFAGKFASRGGGWKVTREVFAERYWGPWQTVNAQSRKVRKFRAFGGIVQEWHDRADGPTGVPSIFAYLTSYGRVFMSKLRSVLPERSVYHQDTDGLWCHPECEEILKGSGYVFGDEPGNLRVDAESSYLRFLTPKHYCVDGDWVISGITPDGQPQLDMRWIDAVCHHPASTISSGPISEVIHADREIDLSMLAPDGVVLSSGWIRPHRIPRARNLIDRHDIDDYAYEPPSDPPRFF